MAPVEVAGYYAHLQDGFMRLGVTSSFWELQGHRFNYRENRSDNVLVRLHRRLHAWRKPSSTRMQKSGQFVLVKLLLLIRGILFITAVARYNVFIFGFGSSFFNLKELPLLKFFGKQIIFVFHGSDSRPPYLDGYIIKRPGFTHKACATLTRYRKKQVALIDTYADAIIDMPSAGHFHTRPFISYLYVGVPQKGDDSKCASFVHKGAQATRILHSPSFPAAKGTNLIRAAIKQMELEGYLIDYKELVGVPNSEVMHEIEKCDFIMDQVYSDTPMPHFAAEAASLGKPVLLCGYYADMVADSMDAEAIPPTCYCVPDDLHENLKRLLDDVAYRQNLGKQAHTFVADHWNVEAVAERFLKIIKGSAPNHWFFSPDAIEYIGGVCINTKEQQEFMAEFIRTQGEDALQLSDKLVLRQKLLDSLTKSTLPHHVPV